MYIFLKRAAYTLSFQYLYVYVQAQCTRYNMLHTKYYANILSDDRFPRINTTGQIIRREIFHLDRVIDTTYILYLPVGRVTLTFKTERVKKLRIVNVNF